MKMRVITISALLALLAAGTCLGNDAAGNQPGSDPADRPRFDLFDCPGGLGFDSEPRPFDMIFAQGPVRGPGSGKGFGGRHGEEWEDRRQHLEQLRMLKMLEALNLSEDQELEFLTAFRAVRKEHGRLNNEKEMLVDSLSALLDNDPTDEKAITSAVDRILAIEDTRRDVMKEFIDNIRGLLTPDQLARFVVFNERFERELLEQVKSFRDRRRPLPEPPTGEG